MLTPKDIISRIKVCSWKYNDIKPELGDRVHFGMIAQDLVDDFGDTYAFVDASGDYLRVNYHEFIGILINVMQEQDRRIAVLEQQIKDKNEHSV